MAKSGKNLAPLRLANRGENKKAAKFGLARWEGAPTESFGPFLSELRVVNRSAPYLSSF